MKPIFITCLGGTGSSLLAKILVACGMWDGNENTYFMQNNNAEHNLLTGLFHMFGQEEKFDYKFRLRGVKGQADQLHKYELGSIRDKIKHILSRYKSEAELHNKASFGVKTASGWGRSNENTCFYPEFVSLIKEVWGDDTIFTGTIRDPISFLERLKTDPRFMSTKGEHLVQYIQHIPAWNSIIDSGYTLIPYPYAFDDGSVKDYVESLGFAWTGDAENVYKKGQPTRIERKQVDEFHDAFSLSKRALDGYNDIMQKLGREDCFIW